MEAMETKPSRIKPSRIKPMGPQPSKLPPKTKPAKPQRIAKLPTRLRIGAAIDFMLSGHIVAFGNALHPSMWMRMSKIPGRLALKIEVLRKHNGEWEPWPGTLDLLLSYSELYKGDLPRKHTQPAVTPQQVIAMRHAVESTQDRIASEKRYGWKFDSAIPTPSALRRMHRTENEQKRRARIAAAEAEAAAAATPQGDEICTGL